MPNAVRNTPKGRAAWCCPGNTKVTFLQVPSKRIERRVKGREAKPNAAALNSTPGAGGDFTPSLNVVRFFCSAGLYWVATLVLTFGNARLVPARYISIDQCIQAWPGSRGRSCLRCCSPSGSFGPRPGRGRFEPPDSPRKTVGLASRTKAGLRAGEGGKSAT